MKHLLLAVATAVALMGFADSPYGYDSHLIRPTEYPHADRLIELMKDVDVGWFRTGMRWDFIQKTPGQGDWDFSVYDDVIARIEAKGIRYLPIFHTDKMKGLPFERMDLWCDYVRRCVERYRGRITHWEVCNEVNVKTAGIPPEQYVKLLKATYETVKACDPSAKVTTMGFAGFAYDYIERMYAAGARDYFDILNVHAYPGFRPEGSLDAGYVRLREIMTRYGDADKPIWLTETGLRPSVEKLLAPGMAAAALKAANPEKQGWRVLVVEDEAKRRATAVRLLSAELKDCTITTCDFRAFETTLRDNPPEALFLPLNCTYPADSMEALYDYLAKGGTVIDMGGYSMYQPCHWKATDEMQMTDGGGQADRKRLRFDVRYFYNDSRYPNHVRSHATEAFRPACKATGAKVPSHFRNQRYFVPKGLKDGDAFIPLISGKTKEGLETHTAAMIRYRSDLTGTLVLYGWSEPGVSPVSREDQGVVVARYLSICFAAGYEKVFWYSLCDCFGLVDPKDLAHGEQMPGQRAFKAFVRRRPEGSVTLPGPWQNGKRSVCWPQWKRPDGRCAGALWSVTPRTVRVAFDGEPVFYNHLGEVIPMPVDPKGAGDAAWTACPRAACLKLGPEPIFFEGARATVEPAVRFEAQTSSLSAKAVLNKRNKAKSKAFEDKFYPTYPSVRANDKSVARPVPDYLRGSVMYQLFPRMFTPEGTFAAATKKLPELKDLGVDLIYLTPHQLSDDDPDPRYWSKRQKASKLGNPKNPYRQKDFYAVDPEYGSSEDLKAFVQEAHRLGLRVMFDLVYFHCGPAAVFLKEHPEYIVRNPDGTPKLGDWAFPEMDIAKREVRDYLQGNMEFLLREYDVDGFRCDVADMLPVDFWEEGYLRCKAIKDDVIMMCEGLKGDDQLLAFDLSYGFYTQWTMVAFLEGKVPASMLETAWRAQARDYPQGFHWMRCFENHDFANVKPGEKRKEELYGHELNAAMIATCFLLDGIPMLYNGQEIADAAPHTIYANRDYGRWCIDWSRADDAAAVERRALVKRLAKLRHENPALFDAPVVWNKPDDPSRCYSFTRKLPNGKELTLAVDLQRKTFELK